MYFTLAVSLSLAPVSLPLSLSLNPASHPGLSPAPGLLPVNLEVFPRAHLQAPAHERFVGSVMLGVRGWVGEVRIIIVESEVC